MSADDWNDNDATQALVSLLWVFFGVPLAFFAVWLLVTR